MLRTPRTPGCFSFFTIRRLTLSTNEREKRVRVNRQIRISPVRVIGADGSQLGIMEWTQRWRWRKNAGWIWSKSRATARPPVVRIMDYGKFKFEHGEAGAVAKKKQHVIQLKEVKYRPGIDDHDFDTKTRHARGS